MKRSKAAVPQCFLTSLLCCSTIMDGTEVIIFSGKFVKTFLNIENHQIYPLNSSSTKLGFYTNYSIPILGLM